MKRKQFHILTVLLAQLLLLVLSMLPQAASAEERITRYTYHMECEVEGLIFRFFFPDDFETTLKGEVYLVGMAADEEAAARSTASSRKKVCVPAEIWSILSRVQHIPGETLQEWYKRAVESGKGNGNGFSFGMSAGKARQKTESSPHSTARRKLPKIDEDKTYTFDLKLIGEEAFKGLEGLTELEIPEGVTTIWPYAFADCKDLKKLVIPKSVVAIYQGCFSGCTSLSDINLPEGLKRIEFSTFQDCTSLAHLDIPNSVSFISRSAFSGCGLESLTLPNSLEKVDTLTFANLKKLSSVIIPSSVKEVAQYAFYGCESLKSVTLNEGLEIIGESAFSDCGLESLNIPGSVKEVTLNPFFGCKKLKSVTLNEGLEIIGENAFSSCEITDISIPSSVKKIRDYAFSECEQLKNVNFSEGLDSIGLGSFYYCTSLKAAKLPNSLRLLSALAFEGCESLQSVFIPSGVKRLEEGTFYGCSSLSKVEFGSDSQLEYIGQACFVSCGLTKFEMPDKVTTLEDGEWGLGIFSETPISYFKLSAAMTYLPSYLGLEESLTTISFGENSQLTRIEERALSGCKKLKQITLPEGVKTIGDGAFNDCTSLEFISFPSTLETIDGELFRNCKAVKDIYCYCVTPPVLNDTHFSRDGETRKANWDFYRNVTLHVPYGTAGTYIATDPWDLFDMYGVVVEEDAPEMPGGIISFADYRVRELCLTNWDTNRDGLLSKEEAARVTDLGTVFSYKYNNRLTYINSFEELQYFTGLTGIPDNAFSSSKYLTSIVLPETITTIGKNAFSGCEGLTSVTIPNSVTSIGEGAFHHCTGLKSLMVEDGNPVYDSRDNCNAIITTADNRLIFGCMNTTIPNTVTSIGQEAFYYCYRLTSVTIPNSVTDIENMAFYGCNGLTTISIGKSVKRIGEYAFYECKAIENVISYIEEPFYIKDNVFTYYDGTGYVFTPATLTVPAGTKAKYEATNGWKSFTKIVEMEGVKQKGDINSDGMMDANDVMAVLNYMAGNTAGISKDAADVNKDGKVDVADVITIVNIIAAR